MFEEANDEIEFLPPEVKSGGQTGVENALLVESR
jgi:hypothetical protein